MVSRLTPKVLLHVEPGSKGAGHAAVASNVAKALGKAGVDVTVTTSSVEMTKSFDFGDRTRIENLPAVPSGAFQGVDRGLLRQAITQLAEGRTLDGSQPWHRPLTDLFTQRQQALDAAGRDAQVIITEFWPLGGVALRGFWPTDVDLVPFITRKRRQPDAPAVISIARDILYPEVDSDQRLAWAKEHLDKICVRGDPRFAALEDNYPEVKSIDTPVEHVGFLGSPLPPRRDMPDEERPVVVTAGGGARAEDVAFYEMAIAAAPQTGLSRNPWRFFLPVGTAPKTLERLQALAASSSVRITVEPNLPSDQYRQIMRDSSLTVSQAGYNSVLDIVNGGVRAVLIPVFEQKTPEQVARAEAASRLAGVPVLSSEQLSDSASLQKAIAQALDNEPKPVSLAINGAERIANLVTRLTR